MESSTYKATFEENPWESFVESYIEGFAEGFRQGFALGAKQALTHVCRELIEFWLGTLPPEAEGVDALGLSRLTRLSHQLIAAASPQAVREALRELEEETSTSPSRQ
jgi:hypothetical protein